METNANNVAKYSAKLTKLNSLLCRVAGSDLNILTLYPHEIPRHARIGAIILSTAALASVSMFFAIQTVSRSIITGVFAGLLWGVAIFLLDSYIIASYRKSDKKWQEIKVALPRLLLAIVLGSSISIPLELQVFSNEISETIKVIEKEKELENQDKEKMTYEKNIAPYKNEKQILLQDNKTINDELKPYVDKVNGLEADLSNELGGGGTSGKYGDGIVAREIKKQLENSKTEKKVKEDELMPRFNSNAKRIIQLDSLIASTTQNPAEEVSLSGISAQLDALQRLTRQNSYVFFAYWIFFLLILGMETAPIFVKFFTAKGSYDETLATNEYIAFLEQQKRKSDLHEHINFELLLSRSVNEKRNRTQDIINEKVLQEIAIAQSEIAEKAILQWKAQQLNKAEKTPEDFIKSTET